MVIIGEDKRGRGDILDQLLEDNTSAGFRATGILLYRRIRESIAEQEELAKEALPPEDIVNVKDFGLVGDGTEEGDKFKLVLKESQETGKTIYFPDGTYNLKSSDILQSFNVYENLSIRGQSNKNTKLVNAPKLRARKDVHIEHISISTSTEITDIFLFPLPEDNKYNFYLNNVKFSGIDNKTFFCKIAVEPTVTSPNVGYSHFEVKNCEFTKCCKAIYANCPIDYALVENNIIYDLGVNANILDNIIYAIALGSSTIKTSKIYKSIIRNNHISRLYSWVESGETDVYSYGIMVHGFDALIEKNYLEDIQGGEARSAIYTKVGGAKIINNTLYNAGDGSGCIVQKGDTGWENRIVVQGNRIMVNKSIQNQMVTSGVLFESDYGDILNNFISMKHGLGISVNDNEYGMLGLNIVNNEIISNGRNTIQVQQAKGKIFIDNNYLTFEPDNKPLIPDATIPPYTPEANITLKGSAMITIEDGNEYTITNNVIKTRDAINSTLPPMRSFYLQAPSVNVITDVTIRDNNINSDTERQDRILNMNDSSKFRILPTSDLTKYNKVNVG